MELAFLPQNKFMLRALELAQEAALAGEVPVGAVIVREGKILGEGRNRREELRSALSHAEIEAISNACKAVGDRRLSGCELYVTLEPCPMCAGAILNAQIGVIVYGADDERAGCCGTAKDLLDLSCYKKPLVYRGFYEAESKTLLQKFFQKMRKEERK